jgi:2-polyprenyl-3-methyl-5-hydroxy-6-metoxy-1,4-benzoquinol methylase
VNVDHESLHAAFDGQIRVYKNGGNAAVLALLNKNPNRVLDVGCGAGDNARLLSARYPACEVHGVTHSATEAAIARKWLTECWVFDIEGCIPEDLSAMRFDAVILSHVLEHLRDPAATLSRFAKLLLPGGCVIVAVPNTLSWTMRWQFLRGNFEYQLDGVLDDTHLRFFTYLTADRYLLREAPDLKLMSKHVTGSIPQWLLRRYVFPESWSKRIDALACRMWPNLFGEQVLLKAVTARTDRATDLHR